MVAAALLSGFAIYHLQLVLRNRTSVNEKDDRYDLGAAQNLCQIFGRQWWQWALPMHGTGSIMHTDSAGLRGHEWQLNPRRRTRKRAKKD